VHWWVVAAAANLVIFVAYLAISYVVVRGVSAGHQWRTNPLAVATGLIFLSCGVGHGIHAVHLLLPGAGITDPAALAARVSENEWHSAPWEAITAVIGIWYWTLRGRFPALLGSSALFEDQRQRQKQALELNDSVVQGLSAAKLAFELGHHEDALRTLDATLEKSRSIVTGLLGSEGHDGAVRPGDLRRQTTVDVVP